MKQTNKWLALTTTCVGTFMAMLSTSIVNVANPFLAQEFSVSMAQIQWISTIYLIVTCSSMLLLGRLGDRVGAHKLYITGIAVFTLGSVFCAASGGFVMLLVARAVQGAGAAMTLATGMGLLTTIFPQEQRGSAMGVSILMVGLGSVAGPAVGGLVLAYTSWQYIFLMSAPFGLIAFILSAVWLRSPLPKNPNLVLDVKGSIVFAGLIACLIIFLSGGFAGQEWFGLGFLLCALLFFLVERKAKVPLFDLELLRNRRFTLGNLITFFSYTANMMFQFQLPFFLDTVWQVPVSSIGLWMMISALTLAVAGFISGFLSDRIGAFRVMLPALIAVFVCILLTFFLGLEESFGLLVSLLVLSGLGMGFLNTPNNSDIMTAAGKERASYASGFVATNRNLGFCIGTALSASVFHFGSTISAQFLDETVGGTAAGAFEHLFAFKTVMAVCLILLLISLVICIFLIRSTVRKRKDKAAIEANIPVARGDEYDQERP